MGGGKGRNKGGGEGKMRIRVSSRGKEGTYDVRGKRQGKNRTESSKRGILLKTDRKEEEKTKGNRGV